MGAEQSQLSGGETEGQLQRKNVNFFINGKEYSVNGESGKVGTETLLVDFIRDHGLKGTKYMCREGGCGACVVSIKSVNPSTGEEVIRSVNSCLMPLFACDGWDISTIEHLGSVKKGILHPIQQRMVNFGATQCGYCTPGWIMNMHALTQSKKSSKQTTRDIEDSMDGNICRCTGYRPILDCMKSMAVDASEELRRKCGPSSCADCPCSPMEADKSEELVPPEKEMETTGEFDKCGELTGVHLSLKATGDQWVKAVDINSLFIAIQRFQAAGLRYRVVAGNTGTGVYKEDGPYSAYVELNSIAILKRVTVTPAYVILGGGVTISEAIEAMQKAGQLDSYEYCTQIATHWKRVANTPVRNAGTLAGNLMLKHEHREFPSDIFLILETIGAMLTIASAPSLQRMHTIQEFMTLNMQGKIILTIHFPKLKGYFRTFKITRRYQNAHAYVNAGFLMPVDPRQKLMVLGRPSIVFGGISPNFVHAVNTEMFFVGKFLDEKTIQGAMSILDSELTPDVKPPDANPIYRRNLAQSLLYKFILGIIGDSVSAKIKSGSMDIERGLSYGKQAYDTDKSEWPLYEPVTKLEAPAQCTGEAEYVNDIHPEFGELAGAYVLTKVGNAILTKVDTTEALKMPGVITFVDAKDIPGVNNYMTFTTAHKPDVIFCDGKVMYAGQPVGLILADTRDIAMKAAKLVKLSYSNVEKPILDIPSALDKLKRENRENDFISQIVSSDRLPIEDGPHSITGEFRVGGQYHFYMEPQSCICIPREDGMDVFSATQWVSHVQGALAECLAMPSNEINIQVRRLGGGFGGKLGRASHVAAACAVAANKVKRPVRLILDIETMMSSMGKRLPYLFKYTASFDNTGKITSLDCHIICDAGCTLNEPTSFIAMQCVQSCYQANNWKLVPGQVTTNLPPNTYCRAPGSPQGIGCIEYIMEHIAHTLKKDPMEVRMINFMKKGDPIVTVPNKVLEEDNKVPGLLQDLKLSADLDDRQKFIQNYNMSNRWKKRGLSIVNMRYPVHYFFTGFNIFISVYAKDGTVSLSHSGIEIGQGINTKVAQVVARKLMIPLNKVKVKPVTSFIGANTVLTGGAVTSEHCCYAALKACEILQTRLAPIRTKLGDPSWELLVAETHKAGIDLTSYYNVTIHDQVKSYDIWGVAACEIEIDVLTGEYKIIRMDVINDAGMSLSPQVDIGQVEGAVVHGLGMWLTEKIQYDQNTGDILTNRTWEYKPPATKDIPEDFRITLMPNSSNPYGVLRSKATGEAPLCMSVAALLAIKQAISAARADAGNMEWFHLHAPVTPEDIQQLCLTTTSQFIV